MTFPHSKRLWWTTVEIWAVVGGNSVPPPQSFPFRPRLWWWKHSRAFKAHLRLWMTVEAGTLQCGLRDGLASR